MYTTMTENSNVIKGYSKLIKGRKVMSVSKKFESIPPDKELSLIIQKINKYIGQPIYRHIYTNKSDCISVVKIIIPKMEGYYLAGYDPVSNAGISLKNKANTTSEQTFDLAAGAGIENGRTISVGIRRPL